MKRRRPEPRPPGKFPDITSRRRKSLGVMSREDQEGKMKVLARLRAFCRRGASVVWAGKRYFVGEKGLEPAWGTKKVPAWGDITWNELGPKGCVEVLRRAEEERRAKEVKP